MGEEVGRPKLVGAGAGGVIGIAFDLGRPALMALNQHTGCDSAKRESRGKIERLAQDERLGLFDVRHDFLGRRGLGGTAR